MSFEADLRSHLLHASITQYVGDRIEPMIRPQKEAPDSITYERVAGVPQTNLEGDNGGLQNIRMQVDIWTKKYDRARLIAEAVRLRMQTAATTFTSVLILDQDLYEDDTRLFRVSMDFSCWYRTT